MQHKTNISWQPSFVPFERLVAETDRFCPPGHSCLFHASCRTQGQAKSGSQERGTLQRWSEVMKTQRSLPHSRDAMHTQAHPGWPMLTPWLPLILVLAIAAWPVVLETYAPRYLVANLQAYRAAHRLFRQRQAVDVAMQGAFRHHHARSLTHRTTKAGFSKSRLAALGSAGLPAAPFPSSSDAVTATA